MKKRTPKDIEFVSIPGFGIVDKRKIKSITKSPRQTYYKYPYMMNSFFGYQIPDMSRPVLAGYSFDIEICIDGYHKGDTRIFKYNTEAERDAAYDYIINNIKPVKFGKTDPFVYSGIYG